MAPDIGEPTPAGPAAVSAVRPLPPAEPAGERHAEWMLRPEPRSAAAARRSVRECLRGWEITETLLDDVVLMVGELVTNAFEHGAGPIRLRVRCDRSLLCEVGDDSGGRPRIRTVDETSESGRGLRLVHALADAVGTRWTGTGKVVWFRLDVRPTNGPTGVGPARPDVS